MVPIEQAGKQDIAVAALDTPIAAAYQSSDQRSAELRNRLHRYNWRPPHGSLKANTPISRLGPSENDLFRIHS
jgi:transposase InsO family protein